MPLGEYSYNLEVMFHQPVICLLVTCIPFRLIKCLTGLWRLDRLLTTDIIMQFAFSRSAGVIEERRDDFGSGFTDALSLGSHSVYIMNEKPWIRHLSNFIPTGILRFLKPEMGGLMDLLEVCRRDSVLSVPDAVILRVTGTLRARLKLTLRDLRARSTHSSPYDIGRKARVRRSHTTSFSIALVP